MEHLLTFRPPRAQPCFRQPFTARLKRAVAHTPRSPLPLGVAPKIWCDKLITPYPFIRDLILFHGPFGVPSREPPVMTSKPSSLKNSHHIGASTFLGPISGLPPFPGNTENSDNTNIYDVSASSGTTKRIADIWGDALKAPYPVIIRDLSWLNNSVASPSRDESMPSRRHGDYFQKYFFEEHHGGSISGTNNNRRSADIWRDALKIPHPFISRDLSWLDNNSFASPSREESMHFEEHCCGSTSGTTKRRSAAIWRDALKTPYPFIRDLSTLYNSLASRPSRYYSVSTTDTEHSSAVLLSSAASTSQGSPPPLFLASNPISVHNVSLFPSLYFNAVRRLSRPPHIIVLVCALLATKHPPPRAPPRRFPPKKGPDD